jgi:hypothetical protein
MKKIRISCDFVFGKVTPCVTGILKTSRQIISEPPIIDKLVVEKLMTQLMKHETRSAGVRGIGK